MDTLLTHNDYYLCGGEKGNCPFINIAAKHSAENAQHTKSPDFMRPICAGHHQLTNNVARCKYVQKTTEQKRKKKSSQIK